MKHCVCGSPTSLFTVMVILYSPSPYLNHVCQFCSKIKVHHLFKHIFTYLQVFYVHILSFPALLNYFLS